MNRILSVLFLTAVFPLAAMAQVKFGYLSYDEAELKRVEDEFNRKYEEFLDGQRDFAPTILQKRQTELQDLLKKNVAFKAESQKLLKKAEEEAYLPLKEKLKKVLEEIGLERGYAFIINTDGDACPFIHPDMGEDVTQLVREAVR